MQCFITRVQNELLKFLPARVEKSTGQAIVIICNPISHWLVAGVHFGPDSSLMGKRGARMGQEGL